MMCRRITVVWLMTSLLLLWGPLAGVSGLAQDDAAAEEEVESPLPSQPETADEYFEAALLMLRLARPELAVRYLEGLMALDPDDQTLLALRQTHGTGTFLQLARNQDLQPVADQLLQRLTEASLTQINDPAYIDGLVADLTGTPKAHAEAVAQLRQMGPSAVQPLLKTLATDQDVETKGVLLTTLVQLGDAAIAPLIGGLQAPRDDVRSDAIEALGRVGDRPTVVPHLWYPAFDDNQPTGVRSAARRAIARILFGDETQVARVPMVGIAQRLRDEARKQLRMTDQRETGEDGLVGVWAWDDGLGTVREYRVTPESASLFAAQKFAREALSLDADDEESQALFLAVALASDRRRAGWDAPIPTGPGTAHDLALVAGAETVERVLELALQESSPAAAVSALDVLGRNGTRRLLAQRADGPPPIVRALDAPNPRVQFAAATAILQLDPNESFRGAARVVEILARELAGPVQRRTVIIDPNTGRGTQVASIFAQLGYESGLAQTGQEGFVQAAEGGRVELAVLHLNTIRWELSQTIANLRADARTANVPIAIYGPAGYGGRVRWLMERNQPVVYLDNVDNSLEVARSLRPVLSQISPPDLTEDQRAEQMAAAGYWLRHIATGHRNAIFDLKPAEAALSNAAGDPELAGDALIALGAVGTGTAQRRLADAIIAEGMDVELRETAALQLAFHIQRFGNLLGDEELSHIQDAWSMATDPALKSALSAVIGSLNPSNDVVRHRLESYPLSTQPIE